MWVPAINKVRVLGQRTSPKPTSELEVPHSGPNHGSEPSTYQDLGSPKCR